MENEHLKSLTAFHMEQPPLETRLHSAQNSFDRSIAVAPVTPVDVERLAELENNELSELVKLFMTENHSLRHENNELHSTRFSLLRDQENVCRENERLLKKLEDVNSVCCRSPLIPARPTISGDIFNFSNGSENDFGNNSNIWKNPLSSSTENIDGRISSAENKMSDDAQKEMDKLRITESIDAVAYTKMKRTKSFDQNGHSTIESEQLIYYDDPSVLMFLIFLQHDLISIEFLWQLTNFLHHLKNVLLHNNFQKLLLKLDGYFRY